MHFFRSKKCIVTALIAIALLLTGCSKSLKCVESAKDDSGLLLTINRCSVEKNKLGLSIFRADFTIQNNSTDDISSVSYRMIVKDKNDSVLYEFNSKYAKNESPLCFGESDTFSNSFSHVIDGNPYKVEVFISKYTTQDELPVKHIPSTGEYLYLALGNEHMSNMINNPPLKIEFVIDHMGNQERALIEDTDSINDIITKFTNVKIGSDTGEFITDNYNGIGFTFSDGTEYYLPLSLKYFEFNANGEYHSYELENFGPIWSLMNELCE